MKNVAQFIPLLIIAAIVAGVAWWGSRRSARKHQGSLVGFGGWLLLLAIGQTIAPLKGLVSLSQSFNGLAALSGLPNGKVVFYVELAVNSALTAFIACVTVAMWRKYPSGSCRVPGW